jgi:acyl-CoA synthetase (AMP-forming)/AMP-acid ligase II
MKIDQFQQYFLSTATCVVHPDGSTTSFAEFWQAVAQHLQYLQQQPATTFALWTEDSLAFATWLWAALLAGKCVILPPHRIAQLEQDLAAQGIEFLPMRVSLPQSTASIVELEVDWQVQLSRDALIFFTSGSTGQPKQIARSLWQLLSEVATLIQSFAWAAPSSFIASVSHQHIYGLLFKILLPLSMGQAFFQQQLAYPEQIEQALLQQQLRQRHSYLIASPALLKRCAGSFTFASCREIFSSGGVLENGIRQHFRSRLIEIFGSSETGGIASRSTDAALWQPLADVAIEIDTEQQLWVQTAHAYRPTWIATGDLAEADDSQFRLLGRADRIVKLEEKRLSLDQIEQQLGQIAGIAQCHLLLIRRQQRDFLAAVVVLDAAEQTKLRQLGKKAMIANLKQQLQGRLEQLALPRLWRFVSDIPRNTQGKISRQQVQVLFLPQLYPWVLAQQQSSTESSYRIEFLPELEAFQGHFQNFAVYPGVAQIGFLLHFARLQWPELGDCQGYEQIKFQQLIRPYMVLDLRLQRQEHKLHFTLLAEQGAVVASGRFVFPNEAS